MRLHRAIAACAALSCFAGIAQADLLGLQNIKAGGGGWPDIYSDLGGASGGYVTYGFDPTDFSAAPSLFAAHGQALTLEIDGVPPPDHTIASGVFDLIATISTAGQASSGSLSISGTVNGLPSPLLLGQLTGFGFDLSSGQSGTFEFLFDITGGSLASTFQGGPIGVILTANGFSPAVGDPWPAQFFVTATAVSDTFYVPEPASLLLALGGLGLLARRRAG